MDKWDACRDDYTMDDLRGRACYGGLDLSSTSDLTALVLVFPPNEGDPLYRTLCFFWLPEETIPLRVRRDHVPYDVWQRQNIILTTEGDVVHYGFIEQFIVELGRMFNIREIAVDRWNASMMVQALQDDGFTMVPFGQGFKDMSNPTKDLMRLVLEQSLRHDGHPILRWCMDNVYVRTDPAGNIKPDKRRRKGGQHITIGVHRKDWDDPEYVPAYVEYGHGGPGPAPAHPYIRPAYDTRQDEAYDIIRDGLLNELRK